MHHNIALAEHTMQQVVTWLSPAMVIGERHLDGQLRTMTSMRLAALLVLSCLSTVVSAQSMTSKSEPVTKLDPSRPAALKMPVLRDGSRDFDFEFGTWKARVARRLRPLTGSTDWVEFDGISTVHKVWGGKANLGELKVAGPTGEIEGLSLRLYDPAANEWKISWANSRDGGLTVPMVGAFDGKGSGMFYSTDTLSGRQILARFIFSGTTSPTFRIEQAFSGDAGRTWEVNWIADFRR